VLLVLTAADPGRLAQHRTPVCLFLPRLLEQLYRACAGARSLRSGVHTTDGRCRRTRYQELFCHLTCSPDGSLFINVTDVIRDPANATGDAVIDGVNVFIDPYFGTRFYESCVNVTFSQSNAPAMLFIGGGAQNYTAFLNYLGKKQPLGSPFDLLFPTPDVLEPDSPIVPWNGTVANCYDTGANRCTCVDCPKVCPPLLAAEPATEQCYVGAMRCLSFTLLMAFSTLFLGIVGTLLYLRSRSPEYVVIAESGASINDPTPKPKDWFIYTWLQQYVGLPTYLAERHRERLLDTQGHQHMGALNLAVPSADGTMSWACGSRATRAPCCSSALCLSRAFPSG
jgi:hypothetical protein